MKPIFLSYARIDNDKDEKDPAHGWVAYLHKRLELALSPRIGKRLDFWRDVHEIEKGATWHAQIKSALREAKILLAVFSPSFLESENCRFELQHFLDSHNDSDPQKLAESVIKIMKHQIDSMALAPAIREPEAFEFFVKDSIRGELSYYHPSIGLRADRQQEFMDELERLANRLATLLKDSGEAGVTPPRLAVFLSVPHANSPLLDPYFRIKAELERRNIKVLPDRAKFYLSLDEPDQIVVEQAVTNSRLAVHLLDPAAEGSALALDTKQVNATDERSRHGQQLRRLIWLSKNELGIRDNDLVASLRRLRSGGGRLNEQDNIVQDSLERFLEQLLRTLFPSGDPTSPAKPPTACYLLVAADDDVAAQQLAFPELRARGFRVRVPIPERLTEADRVAIYWGSKTAEWVFGEIDRLGGSRLDVLIKGPPGTSEKSRFFADEVAEIIDLTGSSPTREMT